MQANFSKVRSASISDAARRSLLHYALCLYCICLEANFTDIYTRSRNFAHVACILLPVRSSAQLCSTETSA
jgi:hypothetical protein